MMWAQPRLGPTQTELLVFPRDIAVNLLEERGNTGVEFPTTVEQLHIHHIEGKLQSVFIIHSIQ
jgi:hypothetical protein